MKVPVYGKVVSGNGASGADVLGGMVVGALLGKALTNDNNAAGVGAVMGGVVAAENKRKQQQRLWDIILSKDAKSFRLLVSKVLLKTTE